jgi:hypothetical protein
MRSLLAAIAFVAVSSTSGLAATPAEILDANHAASGGSAWDTKVAVRLDYDYAGQGLTGTAGGTSDLKDGRFEQDFVIGPQKGANGFDGTHVWAKDNSGIVTLQEGGDAVPLAINNAYRNANLWWTPNRGGADIKAAGQKSENGETYDVLTITPKNSGPFDAWFDSNTHLLYRIAESQGGVLTTTTTTDYRAYDGTMQAVNTITSTGDPKFDNHLTLKRVAFLAKSDPAAYAVPQSAVADFFIVGGAHSVTFPFDLIANHIHAHVMINGKGPYYFVFDTGGVNILTPELAHELGAKIEGESEVRGAGEGTSTSGLTHVDEVDLGGAVIKDQLFATYALDSLYPTGGAHMQGMIGYEVFRRFVTRIDYGARTISLIDPKAFNAADAGAPIRIAFNGNAATVAGSYNGIPAKWQIDTGARSSLTLDAPFVAANHLGDGAKSVTAVDGWGVGGPSRARVTRGGVLKLGTSIEVDHPVTGMGTDKAGAFADPSLSGNVGGGVLKRFVVTFDYGHSTMYLKPITGQVADLDTYDRAGTWFNIAPEGFKVIDVTPGGPADAAGLKDGDMITAVDGKPAGGLSLPAIRESLRNDPVGTVVTFSVQRDGKPMEIRVTLRDQI